MILSFSPHTWHSDMHHLHHLPDRLIFFPNGLPKLKQQPRPKTKSRSKQKARPKPKPKPRQKPHGLNGTELMSNNIEYHDEPNGLNDPAEADAEDEDPEGDGNGNEEDDDDEEEDDDYDDRIRAEIYSNYPHYLHPPSWGINNPLVLASHSPHTLDDDDDVVVEVVSHKKPPGPQHNADELEHDVVVVVDAGPGPHSHAHPHSHTYYTHGDQSSTTGSGLPGPSPTIPSPPKYAASSFPSRLGWASSAGGGGNCNFPGKFRAAHISLWNPTSP